jgi:hypothetical protein
MKINVPPILKRHVKIVNESSENLNLIMEAIPALKNKQVINKAIIEYPINTLFIPGITLITDTM